MLQGPVYHKYRHGSDQVLIGEDSLHQYPSFCLIELMKVPFGENFETLVLS